MSLTVCKYLEIPKELYDDFESCSVEYQEDTGSSGEMVYSYYFEVPDDASDELLESMGWEIGQQIDLPLHVFSDDQ